MTLAVVKPVALKFTIAVGFGTSFAAGPPIVSLTQLVPPAALLQLLFKFPFQKNCKTAPLTVRIRELPVWESV